MTRRPSGTIVPVSPSPLVSQPGSTKTIRQSELNRLAQQLHDLREALRPFADFATGLPPVYPDTPRMTDAGVAFTTSPFGVNYVITFAHLRRAKELLTELEAEDIRRNIEKAEVDILGETCSGCGCRYCAPEGHDVPGYCPTCEEGVPF